MAILGAIRADNASVVCPITSSTKAAIYGGSGPTWECKQWEVDFYKWMGLEAVSLSAAQLQDTSCGGAMKQLGVEIFAMPGGNAYKAQSSVQSTGKINILNFIDEGGLYVGTCAGFFFASSGYFWEAGSPAGGEYHWPNLLGRFPVTEGPITAIHDDAGNPPYKLTGLDNGLKAIYWGGPTRGWRSTDARVPGTTLLHYSDVPGNLLAAVHVNDTSYGNLLLFSVHLEAEPGIGIQNSGLTKDMQQKNWQYRAQQIKAAAKLQVAIPMFVPRDDAFFV